MDLEDSSKRQVSNLRNSHDEGGNVRRKVCIVLHLLSSKQYSLCYFDCDESAGVHNSVVYVDVMLSCQWNQFAASGAKCLFIELGNAAV